MDDTHHSNVTDSGLSLIPGVCIHETGVVTHLVPDGIELFKATISYESLCFCYCGDPSHPEKNVP